MRYPVIVFAALTMWCCTPKKDSTVTEQTIDTVSQTPARVIAPEGFTPLFDGQSLNGWSIYKGKQSNSWEVTDGAIHCLPFDSAEVRADLRTNEKYKDFELMFDWKVAPAANSGVMFRVDESLDEAFFSGPEYQIIDDEGYPGELEPWQLTGACYAMYAPPKTIKVNPIGQWNSSKIIAKGNHIEHWLNNEKVLAYDINSAEWKKLKDGGKWKDEAHYAQEETGYIVLQDHKNETWFKNIFIKPL